MRGDCCEVRPGLLQRALNKTDTCTIAINQNDLGQRGHQACKAFSFITLAQVSLPLLSSSPRESMSLTVIQVTGFKLRLLSLSFKTEEKMLKPLYCAGALQRTKDDTVLLISQKTSRLSRAGRKSKKRSNNVEEIVLIGEIEKLLWIKFRIAHYKTLLVARGLNTQLCPG
ncbi:hypothetical protein PoB_002447800 [Plakobranchus ocellatus]|uniref:Uncharacterized protein n=1 Tax=Plakobranchus ocellatus TaxID=259542 RepID=A0AAV3ZU65_9GAST|nr:hypothetical protein PoB_002447800 [Plakobranchus ocellatus]